MPRIPVGETLQLEPMWSSANDAVATVSPTGLVSAVSPGIVEIYHTIGGLSSSYVVTVTAPPTASPTDSSEV